MYLLVILLAWAVLAEDDQPYCAVRYRRLCQGKGRHVACQFPSPGPGLDCKNYTQIKFTSDLRYYITHYINRRRQRIAAGHERVRGGAFLPRPQIMMFVEWDRELAGLAQRLADQCYFVHDDCRATVRYPYAGQTVGEVRWRRLNDNDELSAQRAIRRVFDAWWGERRRVDPIQLTQPFRITPRGSVWGHFSQIAVWTLRAVGCGAVRHGNEHPRLLLVCDFSHTNMLGQRTLIPGKMAPCPEHTSRRPRSSYPLLCAPLLGRPHDPDIEDAAEDKLYKYEEEDDEITTERKTTKRTTVYKVPAIRKQRPIESLDHQRMPIEDDTRRKGAMGHGGMPIIEDDAPFENTKMRVTNAEWNYAEEITESPARIVTSVQDISSFEPSSKAPFYKKLAVQLGSGKTDESRRLPFKKKIMDKVGGYRAREQSEEGRHRNKVESHNRLLEEEKRFRTRTEEETFNNWRTRKPYIGKWREHQEESYRPGPIPRRPNPKLPIKDMRKFTVSANPNSDLQNLRHKWNWKQTRDRPRRPGAVALLHSGSPERPVATTALQIVGRKPFVMDEEDVKQLFKDTGFTPSWRKSKPD